MPYYSELWETVSSCWTPHHQETRNSRGEGKIASKANFSTGGQARLHPEVSSRFPGSWYPAPQTVTSQDSGALQWLAATCSIGDNLSLTCGHLSSAAASADQDTAAGQKHLHCGGRKWSRKYVNVLVGDTASPEKTYLVESSVVTTVNQTVIAGKIDDVVRKLEVPREKFVLLLSDGASYMTASTTALKVMFPNLFHVTCTAQLRGARPSEFQGCRRGHRTSQSGNREEQDAEEQVRRNWKATRACGHAMGLLAECCFLFRREFSKSSRHRERLWRRRKTRGKCKNCR